MDTYTVGWICALPAEFAAGRAMLDLQHPQLSQNKHDPNSYAFGCIGNHNVVIACLPYGVHNGGWAAGVLNNIRRSFKSLRFCLMVGIGGAVPCTPSDIRLGDIFVSNPAMNSGGGVIQYDSGKLEQHGIFMQTGLLNAPPISLLAAVSAIQANHEMSNPTFPDHLEAMFKTYKRMEKKYSRPPPETDILFNSNYDHPKNSQNCSQCDQDQRKSRSARDSETVVHYGLIASGNGVMKYGTTRDKIWKQYGIECFEMEAAGLMNNFQCLVIRGISDYADSHKNDIWKPYAAAIAAAYTKELLLIIPTEQIKAMPANSNVWYRFKNFNSRTNSIDPDDSFPRRPDDVQITLAPDDKNRLGQYWAFHPRLTTEQFVLGKQWQAVDRGKGAVSLWNNYSGSRMYLCPSNNPATPMRLMLANRDDHNMSQLWFLEPAGKEEDSTSVFQFVRSI
ncbi:nucleoside phosphorylase domain-containing protein [Trichoderma sp. SZMC 28011]